MGLEGGGSDHQTLWVMESVFMCVSGLVSVGVCAIVLHTYSTCRGGQRTTTGICPCVLSCLRQGLFLFLPIPDWLLETLLSLTSIFP